MKNNSAVTRSLTTLAWINRNVHFIIWPILSFFIYKYALEISNGGDAWKTGDWLINYEAGAVRRGLFGQILIYLSNFGFDLKWLTFISQASIYVFIYYIVIRIYLMRQRSLEWCLFLLSPAFLFFPFFSIQGGFRKEIILFLSFAVISYFFAKKTLNTKTILVGYLIYLAALFSHELAAFALPFYFYIFYKSAHLDLLKPRLAKAFSLLFLFTAVSAVVFSMIFPGNAEISDGVCESLTKRGFSNDICSGSIEWLKYDANYGWTYVLAKVKNYIFYLPLVVISIAPIFLTKWVRGSRLFFLIVSFLAFAPLYFLAIDWGRWIHIYVFLSFILIISESVTDDIQIKPIPIWIIGIYLISWSIPHCCSDRPTFGWIQKLETVALKIAEKASFLFF